MTIDDKDHQNDPMNAAFHDWRHNNPISKLFFNIIDMYIRELDGQLSSIDALNMTVEEKLASLKSSAVCKRMLVSIRDLKLEDLQIKEV
jgi:hypothetical protein